MRVAVIIVIAGLALVIALVSCNRDTTDEVCDLLRYWDSYPDVTLIETIEFWNDVRDENKNAHSSVATPVADYLTGRYASNNAVAEQKLDELVVICSNYEFTQKNFR